MALLDPWGHDGKTYDGKEMRQQVALATSGRPGVSKTGDLLATPQGTPNNTVSVAAGVAAIPATAAGLLGSYGEANDAALTSPTFAATGAQPRWDLLCLQVTAGVAALVVVQGTASGSPAFPSLAGLDNLIEICGVQMPANKSIIDNGANGVIVDRRAFWPALVVCTSTTRPPQPFDGQMIEEQDTERVWLWDAGNAQWAPSKLLLATAATLPAAPKQGTPAYVTNAARPTGASAGVQAVPGLYMFDVRWDPPWNLPWGEIAGGFVTQTSSLGSGSGLRDIPGLTITLPVGFAANRKHKISWQADMENLHSDTNIGLVLGLMKNGAQIAAIKSEPGATSGNPGDDTVISGFSRVVGLVAGDVLKVTGSTSRAAVNWASGTVATNPGQLLIEDIGPNGSPV